MRGFEGTRDLQTVGMTVVRMAVRREKMAVRWAWVSEGGVDFDRCDGEGKGGRRGTG